MSTASSTEPKRRGRSASIQQMVDKIEHDPTHHLAGPFVSTPMATSALPPQDATGKSKHAKPKQKVAFVMDQYSKSAGLWEDLRTMRWMRVPSSSATILAFFLYLWVMWRVLLPARPNPFSPLIFISGYIPDSPPSDPRYQKSFYDLLFLAYYIVFWAFIRQSITLYILIPIARYAGIHKEAKLDRFAEQGYAIIYWGASSIFGLYTMYHLPTWWFRTEYFWIDYPQWRMTPYLKTYYLLQFAYWLQQYLVLVLRMERPRKDFTELIIHHYVTLWLIGWSYLTSLTYIGNAIFITMDSSDVFLATSKLLNYLGMDRAAAAALVSLLFVWTYMRHWTNLRILWSVWFEFDLIPADARRFDPLNGVWMAGWIKYQIFIPIFLLQLVNLFWYFLIWRIIYRAVFASVLADDRSDDEDEVVGEEAKGHQHQHQHPAHAHPHVEDLKDE